MILDIDAPLFFYYFPTDPHQFLSESFMNLNAGKADKIVRLIQDTDKVQMGLLAGIRDEVLLSPFSAPFGGFHFKSENIYPLAMESYLNDLKDYARNQNLLKIKLTLAPDIYSHTSNSKLVNVFTRMGFNMLTPDITNWVDLSQFQEIYTVGASRTYYNQAIKNKLTFHQVSDLSEIELIYDLVVENRARMGRPIHMTFDNLQQTSKLFPTDYFKVINTNEEIVAGAIFYRAHPQIAYAVFWGDGINGRPVRAMDFLVFQLLSHYKKLGYQFIDLGISTEAGIPNEGLLRFKETHECCSSLRYTFTWPVNK
jgi:hypothetical protein